MDQQPGPKTQPRASISRNIRSEPSDEAVDVLAKSVQLGAAAGTRKLAIGRYGPEYNVTPAQKVGASAMAGAASVVPVGLLLRGPRSILPGAIVFSLLGAGGQLASNVWSRSDPSTKKTSSWFTSKWSPMTKLSDEQYKEMLEERILRLEADLAILDENRAALVAEQESRAKAEEVSRNGG
ncbi:hypothetical protein J7T55_009187 [Diaporthe amygdali]|uniref:uncharacterized protein n=1 Tax=Phomopsis amygdali TaxID=1214568 RepID=UPI0022FDD058|nr:uncharacterized protein J7T55_009187 [Diaporthe amygdali]KAJ0118404.1 hypothetical protein J7T55_009187 [Diaporthe amygdali]